MGDFIDAIEENQEYNKGIIRFNAKEKSVYEKETYYRIIHPEHISIFGNSISDHRVLEYHR